METLPIEIARLVYKISCGDAFESIPNKAQEFRLAAFIKKNGELFEVKKYQFFRDFYWAHLCIQSKISNMDELAKNEYTTTRLSEFLLINAHLNRFVKFQTILRKVYKRAQKYTPLFVESLKKLFYAGPFPMAFIVVQHLDPMPVQGHLRAPLSHMCEKFGQGTEWNLVFQNSKPAIIKMSDSGKWEIQGDDEWALDAVLEVIKF